MPWYTAFRNGRRPLPAPQVPEAVTAAAQVVQEPKSPLLKPVEGWQQDAWNYYDSLGEFNYGVTWLGNIMSRVRFRAAKLEPGMDEPVITNEGIPAQLVADLAGGVGGQAQLMRGLTVQLSVPGDGYLIGEQSGSAFSWQVRSAEEVRAQNGHFQTVTSRTPNIEWTDLPKDSLVVRVWRPHARWFHVADSPARSARSIMQELELVNRHIIAQYLSRLASAGIMLLPDEVTFPTRPEFEDAEDPFTAEWIEIAAEAIRTPGTASAVIPIPMRVPGEFVEKIKHLDFTLKLDEKIIEKRDSAITRLASKMDIPTEALTGMGKVNHWTAWQLDEASLKEHVAPLAELICGSLTTGYLQPRMAASQQKDAAQWVVWYDMSELAIRPDKSEKSFEAYDRMELSGEALRRESGFDEADKPSKEELVEQGLKYLIRTAPTLAAEALDQLAGKMVMTPTESPAASGAAPDPGAPDTAAPGPPDTAKEPPTQKPAKTPEPAATARLLEQLSAKHMIRFDAITAPGGKLLHPPVCNDHAYSCPFTHAAWNAIPTQLSTGTYSVHLDTFGRMTIGAPDYRTDTTSWIATRGFIAKQKGQVNGHVPV
jgi:hypothetical protein